MLDAKFYVEKLYKKYETRDPFEIANSMDIILHYKNLGKNTKGLCYNKKRILQIFLHEDLNEWEERFVLAHEIGHLIMHPNHNAPFLQTTFFSRNRYEIEANKFAIELLIPDSDFIEYLRHYTIEQIARIYGYSESLLKLKLK